MLVIRGEAGEIDILFSKEGATQGDPLSMIIYGVGMLPLTRSLKRQCKDCIQPWYADDAATGGKFTAIMSNYDLLCREGPGRGYFPEPTSLSWLLNPRVWIEQKSSSNTWGSKWSLVHDTLEAILATRQRAHSG